MPFGWIVLLAVEAVVIALGLAKPNSTGVENNDCDGSAS